MTYFRYKLKKGDMHEDNRECYANSIEDVISTVLTELLMVTRKRRFHRLIKCTDKAAFFKSLPPQYRQYADDLTRLKESMASMYEISQAYTVYDIELAPECYGCRNNLQGQRDHMECPTGCLYNPE